MSLWQKPDQDPSPNLNRTAPAVSPMSQASATPGPTESRTTGKPATIGQSVHINGEITGQEDLFIDGRVQGKIVVKGHNLTIGSNGRVDAEVQAKAVMISGEVTGNVTADDRVEISPSGSVRGDISAPRVALADGSSFKGSIDMGRKSEPVAATGVTSVHRDVPLAVGAAKR